MPNAKTMLSYMTLACFLFSLLQPVRFSRYSMGAAIGMTDGRVFVPWIPYEHSCLRHGFNSLTSCPLSLFIVSI
jgi:hypothetical protein